MTESLQKLVVVTGATGTQGGAVAEAVLSSGKYIVRAITRHPDSTVARELANKGVEIVQATLEDKGSLVNAFKSAYAVYGCTPPMDENEEHQGRNLVDACKANNVPLLIWSSLPNATETSGGKYTKMSLYDSKAAVDRYIKDVGQPAVSIYTGVFDENLTKYGWLQPAGSEAYELVIPLRASVAIPHTWITGDLGPAVLAIIDNWSSETVRAVLEQQPIVVCSYRISGVEMAESIQRITGKTVTYKQASAPDSGMMQMFSYQDDGLLHPDVTIPPPVLTKLGVRFHSFDEFVRAKLVPLMK